VNVTTTLRGVTRTVRVDTNAVHRHVSSVGITHEQAARCEAIWTLGAELVQEEIDRNGVDAGERLATDLESEVMAAVATVVGL
jgi:hypothetical protein